MSEQNNNIHLQEILQQKLSLTGWKDMDVGWSRRLDFTKRFIVYKRVRPLGTLLQKKSNINNEKTDDFSKMSSGTSKTNPEIANILDAKHAILPQITNVSETNKEESFPGSFPAMGRPTVSFDPDPIAIAKNTDCFEIKLSHFDDFESLRALRSSVDSLVIGFDSEWYGDTERKIISWQFALIHENKLIEYVFLKRDFVNAPASRNLWLELALARILDDLNDPKYKRVRVSDARKYKFIEAIDPISGDPLEATTASRDTALIYGKYAYINGKPTANLVSDINNDITRFNISNDDWSIYRSVKENCARIDITLVSHSAKADLTTLHQTGAKRKGFLSYLTDAGGGVFTTRPIYLDINSVFPSGAWNYYYPISLHIRDSMCSAPAGASSLSALGKAVGVPKLELPTGCIEHMDTLLLDRPDLYMEYASTDAVIALLYTSAVYGINKHQAVTILSAGTRILKESMSSYLEAKSSSEFDILYRGLKAVSHGKIRNPDRPNFIDSQSLDPINDGTTVLQNIASLSFVGGYNSCSDVGFYDIETYDYDLQNAYPTAMSLIPDVDWENCILRRFEPNHVLTEQDFCDSDGIPNPFTLMFCCVQFEFPHYVKFPCLPIVTDGIPVFVRNSAGQTGCYACGPELYLAVKLGATVTVLRGYTVRPRYRADGTTSSSMAYAVKQLVEDRRVAKGLCGKGSIEELILKLIVNGCYGKIAQNVKQKNRWSAYTKEMEDIGCSSITNPVSAAMITSIVRAVLLATQNQIAESGYTVYSVTTDGFISNVPEDMLKAFDLYGLRDKLAGARLFLTNGSDPSIWEIKHIQKDLLNLTTRGNASLNTGCRPKDLPHNITPKNADEYYKNPAYELPGVCAHNGTKSGFLPDSYADRLWLFTECLTRTGPVAYNCEEWTPFRKLVEGTPFRVENNPKSVRMDYDLKRKPAQESIVTVHPQVAGMTYEIANFTTVPFETIAEFLKYRNVTKNVSCLRTKSDWDIFFGKLSYHGSGARPRDTELSKIKSVIIAHRHKLISIPFLDSPALSVKEKCAWINKLNPTSKKYTADDWKNARRSERFATMIPLEELTVWIEKFQAISATVMEILKDHSAWCDPVAIWDGCKCLGKAFMNLLKKLVPCKDDVS